MLEARMVTLQTLNQFKKVKQKPLLHQRMLRQATLILQKMQLKLQLAH
jgi:hypothetical protein